MPFGDEHSGIKAACWAHVTFNKQDVFLNLRSTTPEAISQDTGIPQGTPLPHQPLPMLERWTQALQKPRGHTTPSLCHPDVHPVKLAGPLAPSVQTEEERWCVMMVTTSMGRLNLEATRVTPRDTVTALIGRVAFENPQIVAALLGPTKGRKVVGHQDATMEELAEKDSVGDCL